MLKSLKEILIVCGIATLVTLLWQLLELGMLKEIRPDGVDSIIAFILTASLYTNYKFFEKLKTESK